MTNHTHANQFTMLVGLPGSGKSTWLKNYVTNDFVTLSTDDIIEEIAKSRGLTYSDVWSESIKGATKLMEQRFVEAIAEGRNIVWDQTNCTSKKRKTVLAKVPNSYIKVAVVFDTPLDVIKTRLVERALATGKHIPQSVLLNMYNTFEMPTLDEGFDSIRII